LEIFQGAVTPGRVMKTEEDKPVATRERSIRIVEEESGDQAARW